MKKGVLSMVVGIFAVVGTLIVQDRSFDSSSRPEVGWVPMKESSPTHSHVFYAGYYAKVKRAVEVKFVGQAAVIDGEIYRGDDLEAALLKRKEEKKAEYLVLVGEDLERHGVVMERLDRFRQLGFYAVVLMTTRT